MLTARFQGERLQDGEEFQEIAANGEAIRDGEDFQEFNLTQIRIPNRSAAREDCPVTWFVPMPPRTISRTPPEKSHLWFLRLTR